MTNQLFYAWLKGDAPDEPDIGAVLADLGSAVGTRVVEGGYSVHVHGESFRASAALADVAAERLKNAGFSVGRNPPPVKPVPVASPVKPAPPLPSVVKRQAPSAPRLRPQPARTQSSFTPPPQPPPPPQPRIPIEELPRSGTPVAYLLNFLQTSAVRNPTLGYLRTRLGLGPSAMKAQLQVLIARGFVEKVNNRCYGLTERGRQARPVE